MHATAPTTPYHTVHVTCCAVLLFAPLAAGACQSLVDFEGSILLTTSHWVPPGGGSGCISNINKIGLCYASRGLGTRFVPKLALVSILVPPTVGSIPIQPHCDTIYPQPMPSPPPLPPTALRSSIWVPLSTQTGARSYSKGLALLGFIHGTLWGSAPRACNYCFVSREACLIWCSPNVTSLACILRQICWFCDILANIGKYLIGRKKATSIIPDIGFTLWGVACTQPSALTAPLPKPPMRWCEHSKPVMARLGLGEEKH